MTTSFDSSAELDVIKERLAQIHEPAALLEGFFAFAPFGLQVYRADGRCLLVNRAFRELFGSEPPPDYNVLHDDIAERTGVLQMIHRAFAGETVRLPPSWYDPRELRSVDVKEGRRVAIEATFFPVRAAGGQVEHVAVVFKDVTAETTSLEAEQRSNARLRLLVRIGEAVSRRSTELDATLRDAAAAIVPELADWCSIDLLEPDGTIRRAAVAHRDPEKVEMGWRLAERYPMHVDQAIGVARVIRARESIRASELPDEIIQLEARDPDHLEALRALGLKSTIVAPLVAHGRTLGAVSVVWAESGRRYAEDDVPFVEEVAARVALGVENARSHEAARAAACRAEEANRAKDLFLSVVSHELRTPLNAIVGWARMLTDDDERVQPGVLAQGLAVIRRNADAQVRIIEDILDVSRIITGKLRLSLHPVELDRAVDSAIEALAPAASARGVALVRNVDRGVMVLGDFDRLQQIVWNLLSNAIKFTPSGGHVTVSVQRVSGGAEVRVADDGRGIAPEHLPYVFDRFHQIDASTKRAHGGLGLGLSIVRHLTELHGGRVAASSEGAGRGAVFVVDLPRAGALAQAAPEAQDAPPAPAAAKTASPAASPGPLQGVRVLVVDDERDAVDLAALVLGRAGATVRSATSVREALAVVVDFAPHVIATDIAMPEEDGFMLLEQLRKLPPPAGATRAIAMTAYARAEDVERTTRAGFDVHLSKPVDPSALAGAVAALARAIEGGTSP